MVCAYFEKGHIKVIRFFKDGFGFVYGYLGFAIAARPVRWSGDAFKSICRGNILVFGGDDLCPFCLRSNAAWVCRGGRGGLW